MYENDCVECGCYGSIEAEKPMKPTEKRYEAHTMSDPSQPYYFHHDRGVMPHWHENIELLYYYGDASVICDREKYSVKAHDIAIFGSNALHAALRNADTEYDCLIVDTDFLSKTASISPDSNSTVSFGDGEIEALFLKVKHEVKLAREGDRFGSAAVKAAILTLMTQLCRGYSQFDDGGRARGGAVKRAIGFIKSHFEEPLTIDAIAETVNVSKYYFCREFHSETGFTVVRYINNLRCREAQRLLRDEKYSISEIAGMCGFENLSYFSRIYKQIIGETPSETRNSAEA